MKNFSSLCVFLCCTLHAKIGIIMTNLTCRRKLREISVNMSAKSRTNNSQNYKCAFISAFSVGCHFIS